MKTFFTLCALCVFLGDASAQTPAPTGPDGANFWRVPAAVTAGAKRGDIYWARERADVPSGAKGWNIGHRRDSATCRPVDVS